MAGVAKASSGHGAKTISKLIPLRKKDDHNSFQFFVRQQLSNILSLDSVPC